MMKLGVQNWTGEAWVTIAHFCREIDALHFIEAVEDQLDHYRIINL